MLFCKQIVNGKNLIQHKIKTTFRLKKCSNHRLTKHKKNFNNNIRINGIPLVVLRKGKCSVVGHEDGRVERTQQNEPIPANLEYPIMH